MTHEFWNLRLGSAHPPLKRDVQGCRCQGVPNMIRLVQSTWFRQIAFVAIVMTLCATAFAQYGNYGNYVTYGPPPLPVYEQPPLQDEGYIWAPGYWA